MVRLVDAVILIFVLTALTAADAFVIGAARVSWIKFPSRTPQTVRLFDTQSSDASSSSSSSASKKAVQDENAVVAKPLTHIKQNKFAPSPEEVTNKTLCSRMSSAS